CWTALIQRCTRDHLIRSRPRIATGDNLDFISKSNGQVKLFSMVGELFNEVSLTPYTDFVDKTLALINEFEMRGHLPALLVAALLAGILSRLGGHLTAYDLVTFHHRGANYPDALLLDAALKAYLRLIERNPTLFGSAAQDNDEKASPKVGRVSATSSSGSFTLADEANSKRSPRCSLVRSWLLRRQYEGHLVPDAPTSPGENARVLPSPHVRVPEEQILDTSQRTKR